MAKVSKINSNEKRLGTVRHRNRCSVCSRPRGFIRFFGLCRICLRVLACNGKLPGIRKSSW